MLKMHKFSTHKSLQFDKNTNIDAVRGKAQIAMSGWFTYLLINCAALVL